VIAPRLSLQRLPRRLGRPLAVPVVFGLIGLLAYLTTIRYGAPSLFIAIALLGGTALTLWSFFTPRTHLALGVALLYLGLLDGFLRLKTGQSKLTLLHDIIIYSLAAGMLARLMVQRKSLSLPPLAGWILAFTGVVLVQMLNPASTGLAHTLGALRPHLEFVPLFFLGYAVFRTKDRLRWLLVLMLVVATANGIVGYVQLNLTPDQLAGWGPGYSARVTGSGDVSARVYTDINGVARVRPFGLAADAGGGGVFGLISIGAVIALVSFGIRRWEGRLAMLLAGGPVLAVVTSQGRSIVIGTVFAALAAIALTTATRRVVPTVCGVALAGIIGFLVLSHVASSSRQGNAFERYATIAPSKLLKSTDKSRGGSIQRIPQLAADFPVGGGIGSVGPASTFAGGGRTGLDGETEFSFLLSELGIPGLLVLLGFNLRLVGLVITRLRKQPDRDVRAMLGALAAGIIGMMVVWASASPSSTSPSSPFFWLVAGILSYWLLGPGLGDSGLPRSADRRAARQDEAPRHGPVRAAI
jgi:hypothetical protein